MTIPRIDVHAHFLPDFYSDALRAAGQTRPDGMPAIPEWSEENALRMMDGLGIAAAVISISSPGVYFGDTEAAHKLAIRSNEEAARLQRKYPSRFGWFATTSLPNLEAAVVEASEELDGKGADVSSSSRISRVCILATQSWNSSSKSPHLHGELKKLYYDLAGAPLPELLSVLLQVADPHQIMYGSEWPYTPLALCTDVTGKLDQTSLLAGDLREDVMHKNARKLFPKLIEAIHP